MRDYQHPFGSLTFIGFLLFSLTLWVTETTAGTKTASIRIMRGSNLSLFDMFDLAGVECGDQNSKSYRDGRVDTFRDNECTNKKMHIKFIDGPTDLSVEIEDDPPTIQFDAFMRQHLKSTAPTMSSGDIDKLHIVNNVGNFEVILTRDNDTSSGYAAVYNSADEEERPRFFVVKFATPPVFTLEHNQSLLGEMECWKHAFDEYNFLILEMEYDDSCKETNATYRYDNCGQAVEEELCDCDCAYFEKMRTWETKAAFDNRTEEAKAEKLEQESVETKQKLSVNKTSLSSGKRKKISAPDDRASATNIGILGIVLLGLIAGSLLVCDLLSIKRHIQSIKQNR